MLTVCELAEAVFIMYSLLLLGTITMEEVLTVLPFGGTFDLVQIKGLTVKKAFEHSIHRYGSMSGEFLQVSGLLVLLCSSTKTVL